jgi:DNA repair protein RecO (recombination protein O)
MPARVSEAIILRSYPLREADLIISFFTRDCGKLRGVARRARKPGSRFGSALERLSYVKAFYFERENRELVTLDSCEVLVSRFQLAGQYETVVALDYFAELSEHLLPQHEPSERFFRLLLAMTDYLANRGAPGVWTAATYFTLWAVRLSGFLPPLALPEEDRAIAEEMLHTRIADLAPRDWTAQTAATLRRCLWGVIEDHVERRLVTPQFLNSL